MIAVQPTSEPNWQQALQAALLQRLLRPLHQAGVIAPDLAQCILERIQRMAVGLPLLARLQQHLGDSATAWSDLPLIVHAQALPNSADGVGAPLSRTPATSVIDAVRERSGQGVVLPLPRPTPLAGAPPVISKHAASASDEPQPTLASSAVQPQVTRGASEPIAPIRPLVQGRFVAPLHPPTQEQIPLRYAAQPENVRLEPNTAPLVTPLRGSKPDGQLAQPSSLDAQRIVLPAGRRRRPAGALGNVESAHNSQLNAETGQERMLSMGGAHRADGVRIATTPVASPPLVLAGATHASQPVAQPMPQPTMRQPLHQALPVVSVIAQPRRASHAAPPVIHTQRRRTAPASASLPIQRRPLVIATPCQAWPSAPITRLGLHGAPTPIVLPEQSMVAGAPNRTPRLPLDRPQVEGQLSGVAQPSGSPVRTPAGVALAVSPEQRIGAVDDLVDRTLRKLMRQLNVEGERKGWRR